MSIDLKDRVLVEETPGGQEYLDLIMNAMRDNRVLRLVYGSFVSNDVKTMEVEPYCMKNFQRRWYMLANADSGKP